MICHSPALVEYAKKGLVPYHSRLVCQIQSCIDSCFRRIFCRNALIVVVYEVTSLKSQSDYNIVFIDVEPEPISIK